MASSTGAALKEFFVSLGLDADQASWASAKLSVDALEAGLHKLVAMAERVGEVLAESVVGTAEFADHIGDVALQTGLSTRSLQQFGLQAAIAGSSSEEFVAGVSHMAKAMAEARDGGEEAQKAFGKLGVRVTDGHGKLRDQEEVLNDVADALQKLPAGAERTAAAMSIFSRSGKAMVGVLANGAEGLRKLNEESDALGLILSEDEVKVAGDFADKLEMLGEVGKSLQHDLALPIIEALSPIIDKLKEWIEANRDLIRTKLQDFARGLVAAFRVFLSVSERVVAVLGGMWKVLKFLIDGWKIFGVAIVSVATALAVRMIPSLIATVAAFFAQAASLQTLIAFYAEYAAVSIAAAARTVAAWAAAALPIIALAALIGFVILAIDDVQAYLRGADSVIGDLGEKWTRFMNDFTKQKPGDGWLLTTLKQALAVVTDIEGTVLRVFKALGFKGVTHEGLASFFSGEGMQDRRAAARSALAQLPDTPEGRLARAMLQNNPALTGASVGASGPQGPIVPSLGGSEPGGGRGASSWISAPQTNYVTVHAAPGQSAAEVGAAVKDAISEHWQEQMRAAAAAKQGG